MRPRCEVCGKSIPGIRYANEKAYCSKACMDSIELFELRKSREDYDARRERFLRISWIVIALLIAFFIGVFCGEYIIKQYLLNNPDMIQVCTWLVDHVR